MKGNSTFYPQKLLFLAPHRPREDIKCLLWE
jgi:hypothetical protein